jgi:MFS family permease
VAADTITAMNQMMLLAGGPSPFRTELILTIVNAVDAADMALLPGIFRVLEMDFFVTPKQLGVMVFWQNILKSTSTVAWGFIADRHSRKMLLSRACLGWGALTLAIAICSSFYLLASLRILSVGVLAIMMPLSQGMLADIVAPERRGDAFGRLGFWSNIGGMIGGTLSTMLSATIVLGAFRGWRLAFGVVAVVSLALVPVIEKHVEDPPKTGEAPVPMPVCKALGVIASKPTFSLLVLQGVFGEMPWIAFGTFSTLFFQYVGLSNTAVAGLFLLRSVGGACGTLFGGRLGDWAHKRSRNHGIRI